MKDVSNRTDIAQPSVKRGMLHLVSSRSYRTQGGELTDVHPLGLDVRPNTMITWVGTEDTIDAEEVAKWFFGNVADSLKTVLRGAKIVRIRIIRVECDDHYVDAFEVWTGLGATMVAGIPTNNQRNAQVNADLQSVLMCLEQVFGITLEMVEAKKTPGDVPAYRKTTSV